MTRAVTVSRVLSERKFIITDTVSCLRMYKSDETEDGGVISLGVLRMKLRLIHVTQ